MVHTDDWAVHKTIGTPTVPALGSTKAQVVSAIKAQIKTNVFIASLIKNLLYQLFYNFQYYRIKLIFGLVR